MQGMGLPVLVTVVALGMAGTAIAANRSATFLIGSAKLTMPVPDSFCTPTGKDVEIAATNALADKRSATLATFLACGRNSGISPWAHYVLVKSPNETQAQTYEKEEILARLDAEGNGPNSPRFTEAMTNELAQDTESALGERIEFRGTFGFAGRDKDCVYLAGPMQITLRGRSVDARAATCLTAVSGKVLTVNVYDFRLAYTVPQLKEQAHAIALTIRR
jgi:hypothetical protein